MKTKLEMVKWEADAAFEVSPQNSRTGLHRFSAACLEMFHSLKQRISSELAFRFGSVRPQLLRQAVNEAEALAASTAFPALFLPALAEEKVFIASQWERKQRSIQDRSWLQAA